jgi:hypothetical protein
MKKRCASLENKPLLYIVFVIAVFNIVAYVSVQDWNSILVFVLAGLITYTFDTNKTIVLIVAIISASVFKASLFMKEGMEQKKKKEKEPVPDDEKIEYASPIKGGTTLEGLTKSANNLMDRQEKLHQLAGQLEPMMKQAQMMMNNLPKGFLKDMKK